MKITCNVMIINRNLPPLNISGKKPVRSNLVIGMDGTELILLHQTNDNTHGNLYKVKNNIENVFMKFVNEGKATIRFKEPQHDLSIKCDPIQLKGFLKSLKLGLEGNPAQMLSTINKSRTDQHKILKPIKTRLKISSKEEYPITQDFPRTLQTLTINNANQKRLDSRILRLRSLTTLNLENNNLTTLPELMGNSLPNLSELMLKNNLLGQCHDWRWIVNSKLQKQLRLLDLQINQINYLPDKIAELKNLVTLKVDNNNLECLPYGIGSMKSLRILSLSNNRVRHLPNSIFLLKLDTIDVSDNNFWPAQDINLNYIDFQVLPRLLDIAASNVITNRMDYSDCTLPRTLIDHLQSASICICGKPCFSRLPEGYVSYFRSRNKAHTVVTTVCQLPVAVQFCSYQCYTKRHFIV